ncbi:YifB family Mg chelatase-like AAA ATPase [Terrilactibacillus laevilacticus]|uniref:YifB family Mg chelatase-like AAA ATPase n=1 Tax=Terrilactibacillus laevilacticus TaxID=1380157 RepID=UPI00114615B9|nr:YifB family Mg chelatase-like AAA ATPase [Terrilactibacillus laevilacticus]
MTTIVQSIGLKGLEGYKVKVEVQVMPGKESVCIVGLPDACVKESKERVVGALYSLDCEFLDKKVIVNLSPAEQRKNSPIFDLAMAIGMMKEVNYFQDKIPDDAAFLGALSLDGTIKPVEGMLPAVLAAKKEKVKQLYLPVIPDLPLTRIEGIDLHFVHSLAELLQTLSGQLSIPLQTEPQVLPSNLVIKQTPTFEKDFQDIIGHSKAKRALEIAAAGGHNVLLIGPPGCGKSLLSETFPSILPPLTLDHQFEVMSIYQLSGVSLPIINQPPFRSPHHSSSAVSLIGGGTNPKPGEVSLAHRGVLFLDEMAEFPKRTLDMLRQPMESGKVTISRAASTVSYPARFILIGAMNPCPCGYLGARDRYCTCTPKQIQAYQNRISGPVLDRMDILLNLTSVSFDLESREKRERSSDIRDRVIEGRIRQYQRYGTDRCNATIPIDHILQTISITQQKMVQKWFSHYHWSNRVQTKIYRLARTIADLNGDEKITNEALWEAMSLRRGKKTNDKSNIKVR